MLNAMTLLLFTAAAVTKDRQTCRIPNGLLLAGAINGCFLRFWEEGWSGIGDAAAGCILPLIVCGGLFIFSMVGAGDIKLLMAIGIYTGFPAILRVMLYTCVIGGGLALVKMFHFRMASERIRYMADYFFSLARSGTIKPYIDMDRLYAGGNWLMHLSVPIMLAVMYELAF